MNDIHSTTSRDLPDSDDVVFVSGPVHPPIVSVFTAPGCQRCKATSRHLTRQGIAHAMIDVTENRSAGDQLRRDGWTGLPVVRVVGRPYARSWEGYRGEMIDTLAADIARRDAEQGVS